MQGKLITIYGVNNMGKSTHAKLLVERLRQEGFKAEYVKYPVYDVEPSGPFIDKVLRGGTQKINELELQLWFILNRHQFQPQLEKWLNEGVIVIAEDYIGTGIAWGKTKGLDKDWLINANKGLHQEDFTLLMTGERVKKSAEDGHVHEQNDSLVDKCYETFIQMGEENNWQKIQLKETKEETANLVWEKVEKFLSGVDSIKA